MLFPCFLSFFPYIFTSSFWNSWSTVAMFVGGMENTDHNVTTGFGKMGKLNVEKCVTALSWVRHNAMGFWYWPVFLTCTASVLGGRPGVVCVIRAWGDRRILGCLERDVVVWHYSKIIIKIIFFCQPKNKMQYFPNQISSKPSPLSCNTELLVEKQELNLCLEWHFSASFLSGLYLHYLFIIIKGRLKSTWRFLWSLSRDM